MGGKLLFLSDIDENSENWNETKKDIIQVKHFYQTYYLEFSEILDKKNQKNKKMKQPLSTSASVHNLLEKK